MNLFHLFEGDLRGGEPLEADLTLDPSLVRFTTPK
jgi:hypothetical protein